MKILAHAAADPVFILTGLYVLLAAGWLAKKIRLRNIMIALTAVWFFLIAVSPVPQWLVRTLESGYPAVNLADIGEDRPTFIVVLGGGHAIAPDLPETNQLSKSALGRLVEAIRIKRSIGFGNVVCSGYSKSGRTTQAEMLSLSALALGVSPVDTLMLTSAKNTREEARAFTSRFGTDVQLILVTDAAHMPRAMSHFRNAGCDPIAAPTNHYIKIDPEKSPYNFVPSVLKIEMMERVMYEYLALIELLFSE